MAKNASKTRPIKNWKLALLAFVFIGLFSWLGHWQWSRATGKKILQQTFAARLAQPPLNHQTLPNKMDIRYYRGQLIGTFDNDHTFLLDNKTHQGKIGYEVYTPFAVHGLDTTILIDRGFVPINHDRRTLPHIPPIIGQTKLVGMFNLPPTYMALGHMTDTPNIQWPLRVEYMDKVKIESILHTNIYPYFLIMAPSDKRAFATEWQFAIISPERHMAYAIQWFALAATLLILFVALNRG